MTRSIAPGPDQAPAAGLFAWWRRQLRSLMPGWAWPNRTRRDAIIIDILTVSHALNALSPTTGQVLIRRSGQERIAGQLDFSRLRPVECEESDVVILRLPPEIVLRHEMTLPIAAERDLQSLIHFQMPQLTPFDPGEVFWGISEPVREKTRLKLTLHVVQRRLVDGLLKSLAGIGLEPSVLVDGADGIELARFAMRGRRRRIAGLGICAALAMACLLTPLIIQQVRLGATGQRLRELLPIERQIMTLNDQISGLTQAQMLIDGATSSAPVLRTLALLTGALPDATWLNDLIINGKMATFDGQSSDAANLISVLTAIPGLRNVNFNAPVTLAPAGGELFSIQLSISN